MTDPLEIGKLLVLLGGLAGIYLKLQSALRQMAGKGDAREITNNPLNTQNISRPATMEDLGRVDDRVSAVEKRLQDNQTATEQWRMSISEDIIDLRDRIDDKLDGVNDSLKEINRAVGRLEH